MKTANEMKTTKIPILTDEEILELGKIMYSNNKDELLKKRFWKNVYKERGLQKGDVTND